MTNVEPKLRRFLSTWQFWNSVWVVCLIAIVVALVVVVNRTSTLTQQIAREQAVHDAEIRSTAQSTFNACVASIPELRRISVHLKGVNQLAAVLLANSKAVLDETQAGDPELDVRRANYGRLLSATKQISAVQDLPVPTVPLCRARRRAVLVAGGIS